MGSTLDAPAEWPTGASFPQDAFVSHVLEQGRLHYRDLPWRYIDDPYAVLVSEVMLQQTQVPRVLRKWRRFLDVFPTLDALAAASTSDVLTEWQGLGYNRRALALKACAEKCSSIFEGSLPGTYDDLIALPGIGPATAAGVLAFAFNKPGVYLETNVRTVFLHDVFRDVQDVSDKRIVPLVAATCQRDDPRTWYYALLDYGAHLKASVPNPSRRSAHYAKQSKFEGSRRQKRAWIVRRVLVSDEGVSLRDVYEELNREELSSGRAEVDEVLFRSIIEDLLTEGFFKEARGFLVP